jgi:hypothetical protein
MHGKEAKQTGILYTKCEIHKCMLKIQEMKRQTQKRGNVAHRTQEKQTWEGTIKMDLQ